MRYRPEIGFAVQEYHCCLAAVAFVIHRFPTVFFGNGMVRIPASQPIHSIRAFFQRILAVQAPETA